MQWSPDSWRQYQALQQPKYPDQAALSSALCQLRQLPPHDDENFLRQILVGQEKHVQKVPQWYGENIGFWDGTTLVTWTANVQDWWFHTMFEYSDKMEAVQTLKPAYDATATLAGDDVIEAALP